MASRKRPKRAPNPNSKSTPIAFRLDRTLVARLDDVSQRVGVPRNKVVALVLTEYVVNRGDAEVERIVKEAEANERPNLFG